MIRTRPGIVLALAALCCAPVTSAIAQAGAHEHAAPTTAPAVCAAPESLPGPLAGWAAPHRPVAAARNAKATRNALLTPGQAADVTLQQTPRVTYPVEPGKPGGSVSFGGLLAFDVAEAGTYRVALGSAAWIDVVEDGASLVSIAHGHGPECSGIRKMVDYTVKPGRHVLQIAASGDAAITVLVTKLP